MISEATEQFKPLCVLNEERYDIFKEYCDAIDLLIKEFDGIAYSVFVDDIKMTVSIAITVDEIFLENKNHIFYQLAERAISVSFSKTEDDYLEITFKFPSLWEKV